MDMRPHLIPDHWNLEMLVFGERGKSAESSWKPGGNSVELLPSHTCKLYL